MFDAVLGRRALVGALAALSTACGDSGICGRAELEAALAAAAPGDTVLVGACVIEGSFVLPDEVTLAGQEESVLRSTTAEPVVSTDGSVGATLRDLRVEVQHGGVGIRAVGGGTLHLEDVTVDVTRGIAVGIRASGAEVHGLSIVGPIDETNADFASLEPADTGAFGLVGAELGAHEISLERFHAEGFSVAAVSLAEGTLSWVGAESGADVEATRGVGVALFGTEATLDSVAIDGMLSGFSLPGLGLTVSSLGGRTATLDASGLAVTDGAGYGLFSDGADVVLRDATFADLGLAGARLQGGTFDATDLVAERNRGAGVMAINTVSVSIERARLDAQLTHVFSISAVVSYRIGDGIDVLRDPESTVPGPPLDLRLADVTMTNNERAGLLLDAADGLASVDLVRVEVTAMAAGFGAVKQRTPLPIGWDSMVVRSPEAVANDLGFPGMIDVLGIMMPPGFEAMPPDL